MNAAIGQPVAEILGFRKDLGGKPSNGLYVASFDLTNNSQKTLKRIFGNFAKGKKVAKKVSVILNTDRFGDPYALVYFPKEQMACAKEAYKKANYDFEGLWIGNERLTVRYPKV